MQAIDQRGPAAVVLFYDPSTGEVVHGHYHEGEPGSELPDLATLEALAIEHARLYSRRRKGFDVDKLSIHHVDASNFHMDRVYKVDTKTKRLLDVTGPGA